YQNCWSAKCFPLPQSARGPLLVGTGYPRPPGRASVDIVDVMFSVAGGLSSYRSAPQQTAEESRTLQMARTTTHLPLRSSLPAFACVLLIGLGAYRLGNRTRLCGRNGGSAVAPFGARRPGSGRSAWSWPLVSELNDVG